MNNKYEQLKKELVKEENADEKEGILLQSAFSKKWFFRIYDKDDKEKFDDYDLGFGIDPRIIIKDEGFTLKTYNDETKVLDFSSEVLGLPKLETRNSKLERSDNNE